MGKNLVSEILDAVRRHPKKLPLNERGQLVPDPTPMAPPIGYRKQESMVEIVRRQVMLASEEAKREGRESFEESDDFDVGDDPEITSPYELDAEGEVPLRVLQARAVEAHDAYIEAKRAAGLRMQDDSKAPPGQKSVPEGRGEGGGPPNSPPDAPPGDK